MAVEKTDELIMKKVANGDLEAFKEIVHKYGDMIYNVCFRFAGNSEDANDLVQDVFLKALENAGSFRRESTVSTWLYSIAVHHGLNVKNRRKKILFFSIDKNVETEEEDIKVEPKSNELGIEDQLIKDDTEKKIQKALDELNPDHKVVIVLRYIQDLPYDEIAKVCVCSIGTVGSRLARALEELKELLKTELGGRNEL